MSGVLGFFHRGRHSSGHYGVTEAENELLAAIVKYSSWEKIVLWKDNRESSTIYDSRIEVRSTELLNYDLANGYVDVVHHVGLGSSFFSRARQNNPIPVFTSVFPALSYNEQIKTHLFDLLSRKTNQDTNIFPSQCSMEVVKLIYKQLTDSGITKNGETKNAVIPIGVDIDKFSPCTEAQRKNIRENENLPQEAIIALLVSRFSPSDKADILPLIRSIKYQSIHSIKNIIFLIVGGDGYFGSKAYIKILKDEVIALGLQDQVILRTINNRSRIIDLVRSSNIFLSPADSVQETFGITPLEAMSAGLPVIVSDWNGYRETVVHGKTGYLAKTTIFNNENIWNCSEYYSDYRYQHIMLGQSVFVDTDTMIRKCYELAKNHDILSQMSISARNHVLQNYTWDRIIAQYEKLWFSTNEQHTDFLTENKILCTFDYFKIFKDYATETCQDDRSFEITQFGIDVYKGNALLQIISDLSFFISANLVKKILQEFICGCTSVSELTIKFKDQDRDSIRFCAAWMNKNNIIKNADGI